MVSSNTFVCIYLFGNLFGNYLCYNSSEQKYDNDLVSKYENITSTVIDVKNNEEEKISFNLQRIPKQQLRRSLEIRVAMKDESDTSLEKGDTKTLLYRVSAYRSLVGRNFVLTFGFNEEIVNLTNLNAENKINININATIVYFNVDVKGMNVGKTNIQIIGIHDATYPYRSGKEVTEVAKNENKTGLPINDGESLTVINNSTITVSVYNSEQVKIMSEVFGWMYFFAWVVIFYPQIYGNWKAKSVVGVNFDFLAIVLVDLSLYTIYMLGLFFSSEVQREYKIKHDTEVIPVKINDVVFGILTITSSLVVIGQCRLYKSGGQKVSQTCKSILGTIFVFLFIVLIITLSSNALHWIDFLTYSSFVKIFTCTKYVPQVYMNFKRRSTSGFSVGVVICDVNGGLFSIAQMVADSYNFDDWSSFSGNPTKFIVGVFTLVFDVILIIQHYACYRNSHQWERIPSTDEDNDENSNNLTTPNA